MLRWSFYVGVGAYSFLLICIFFLLSIFFEQEHLQGNGFHLATLQTVITLCTLTSIYTTVRKQTKERLENILIKDIIFINPEIMNNILDFIKTPKGIKKSKRVFWKHYRKTMRKEIESLFKFLIYTSSIFTFIDIFVIGMDCQNCFVPYFSLLLFFPSIFLCLIFLKIEYLVYLGGKDTNLKKICYRRALKDFCKPELSNSVLNKIKKIKVKKSEEDSAVGQSFLNKTSKLFTQKPIQVHIIYYN
ncbi:hypothetical protein [Akkermansia sp.]|uniref:hypothetical protein n=1 Tax=Akkermansia sp. TaxID=1872421 RepID=UPI002671D666|nr:hypothetical protein [Akkermansia sp.]MEE0764631.1 hypothetical protein [Akkermansia sp.]